MNKKIKISIFSVFVLLTTLLAVSQSGGAISIRELFGFEEEAEAAENEAAAEQADLSFARVRNVLANVDNQQKQALLADADAFKQFVTQQANRASVLAAARANKVDEDKNTVFLMQHSAENVLHETYLNKLTASKIPADFPSEAQAREYFDKNRETFTLPERVHVWQVFLQVTEDMDEAQLATLQQEAQTIAQDIRSGKLSFAEAAKKYSDHVQSKVNGGYMGLINVTELKPEIGEILLALPADRTSAPIKADTGFHIVKRGARVPTLEVEFAQVNAQIKNLLRQQAATQLRQAAYERAGKTYPIELQDEKIEEWRLQLNLSPE